MYGIKNPHHPNPNGDDHRIKYENIVINDNINADFEGKRSTLYGVYEQENIQIKITDATKSLSKTYGNKFLVFFACWLYSFSN